MYTGRGDTYPRSLQAVWRYINEEYLLDLVRTGEMYFRHLPKLSDGLEGSLTARTRERLFRRLYADYGDAATANAAVNDFDQHREAFYVNCWHMNDAESYLMWKVYADRGFAIETTVERLQLAFDSTTENVEGAVVNYLDYGREEFTIGNVFPPVLTKDTPYKDEREFRLLIWKPPVDNRPIVPPVEGGMRVPVDVGALLRRVHVSPQLAGDAGATAELVALLREKGLDCEIARSVVQEKARGGA